MCASSLVPDTHGAISGVHIHLHHLNFTEQTQDIFGSKLIYILISPLIRHLTCTQ